MLLPIVTYGAVEVPEGASVGQYSTLDDMDRKDRDVVQNASELEAYFERRGFVIHDAAFDAYMQEIAAKLMPPATDPFIDYRFAVINDPVPNAFALPDGQIYVHSGLIAWLESEAQFAGLLAHEINHVAGHHTLLTMRDVRKDAVGTTVITGMLGAGLGLGGALAGSLITLGVISEMYEHSRECEAEADVVAVERLVDAGYDVAEFAEMFMVLKQDFEGLNVQGGRAWRTHPYLDERRVAVLSTVSPTPTGDVGRERYQTMSRRIALGTVEDYLEIDMPRSAYNLAKTLEARYGESAQLHLSLGDALVALGARDTSADLTLNDRDKRRNQRDRVNFTREERFEAALAAPEAQRQLGDNMAQAIEHYNIAKADPETELQALRGLGDAFLLQGEHRASGRAYMQYLKKHPEALDRSIVIDRLRVVRDALTKEGES